MSSDEVIRAPRVNNIDPGLQPARLQTEEERPPLPATTASALSGVLSVSTQRRERPTRSPSFGGANLARESANV